MQLFNRLYVIDPIRAKQIYKAFTDNAIFQIPTEDSIKGWGMGCDGEEFLIEYSTNTFYSFKEYWTPSMFKEVKEAVAIQSIADKLDSILDLRTKWNDFLHGLPGGCYSMGEMVIVCNPQTKSEIRQTERKNRRN